MTRQAIKTDHLYATVRECWVWAHDLRVSAQWPEWTHLPTLHALVIETVNVPEEHRQQGHCRRLIEAACADGRFEMVVVEGVGNPVLAAALARWGWDFDHQVKDFYWCRDVPV